MRLHVSLHAFTRLSPCAVERHCLDHHRPLNSSSTFCMNSSTSALFSMSPVSTAMPISTFSSMCFIMLWITGVCEHCPAAFVSWLQSPGTPNSNQHAYGVTCTATGDSSTLVFRLDLRNFECFLGGRGDWLSALAHDWHTDDLVGVPALWDLSCFSTLNDRGDLSLCLYRQVHDLLESLLLHSFLQRLDLLEFVQSGFSQSVCLRPGEAG